MRNQLKKLVEGLGYDEGLESVLLRGGAALPDSKISKLLSDIDQYQDSITGVLARLDSLIEAERARANLEEESELKVKVAARNQAKTVKSPPRSPKTSVSSNIHGDQSAPVVWSGKSFFEGPEFFDPNQHVSYLTLSTTYFEIISKMLDVGTTWLIAWTPLGTAAHKATSRQNDNYSDQAVAAVKSALAATNSAFESMAKAAKAVADVTEENVHLASRQKQIISYRTQTKGAKKNY